jgi:hypothetical protein
VPVGKNIGDRIQYNGQAPSKFRPASKRQACCPNVCVGVNTAYDYNVSKWPLEWTPYAPGFDIAWSIIDCDLPPTGVRHMPIRLLIDNSDNSYLAMDAAVLIEAFEGALSELELVDRNDAATQLVVANHIITLAKAGEHNPLRLRDLTLKAIGQEQRHPLTASMHSIPGYR